MDEWLTANPGHVAAVHCKAGKGRTGKRRRTRRDHTTVVSHVLSAAGTMICCYLLHCRIQVDADDCLRHYGIERTYDGKGVTIPSQRRYVHYYANLLKSRRKYERIPLQVRAPHFRIYLLASQIDNVMCCLFPHS